MQGEPDAQVDDFCTQYHPKTGRSARVVRFDQYGREEPKLHIPTDKKPWISFRTKLNFEFSELMLEAALNRKQITKLISLVHRACAHKEEDEGFTVTSYSDLDTMWESAKKKCVAVSQIQLLACWLVFTDCEQFKKKTVSVPYRQEMRTYDFHFRPLWDWAMNIVDHPRLAPQFTWDAEKILKFNGLDWERVYHEPWTANDWWSVQVSPASQSFA